MTPMSFVLLDWPFVGLFAAATICIVLFVAPRPAGAPARWRDPSWLVCLMLPVYMLHQFEEHGFDLFGNRYPFQAWFCAAVGFHDVSTCPGDRGYIFAVNVGAIWIAGVCAIAWRHRNPLVGACAFSIPFLNAIAHLNGALRQHVYNPGLLTSVVLFLPVSIYVFRTLLREGALQRRQIPLVIACGLVLHAILVGGLLADGHGWLSHPVNLAIQAANGFVPLLFAVIAPSRTSEPTGDHARAVR